MHRSICPFLRIVEKENSVSGDSTCPDYSSSRPEYKKSCLEEIVEWAQGWDWTPGHPSPLLLRKRTSKPYICISTADLTCFDLILACFNPEFHHTMTHHKSRCSCLWAPVASPLQLCCPFPSLGNIYPTLSSNPVLPSWSTSNNDCWYLNASTLGFV